MIMISKVLHQGPVLCKTLFHKSGGWGVVFDVIQVHYIYHVLYFYCNYINSTSDHQGIRYWRLGTPDLMYGPLSQKFM